jgi:hypothetical protein
VRLAGACSRSGPQGAPPQFRVLAGLKTAQSRPVPRPAPAVHPQPWDRPFLTGIRLLATMPVVGGLASGRMRTPGRWWFVNSPQPQNQLNGPHDNRAACNRLAPPCSEFIDVDLCRVSDLLLIDTGKDASRFKPIPRAGLHGVARAGVAQRRASRPMANPLETYARQPSFRNRPCRVPRGPVGARNQRAAGSGLNRRKS